MARILVIDDDEMVSATIAQMLTGAGYEVALSNGGEDGCRQCHSTQFDLVICDVFMPGKDGIETVRELRASALKVPIICVTGGGSHRDVTGADADDVLGMLRLFGATQTLTKPFQSSELLATVEACLLAADAGEEN